MTATRRYEPNPKHKWPKGFGSLCPKTLPPERISALLADAIAADDAPDAPLYAVEGDWCFEARPTRLSEGLWHGYPVPGCEVPPRVFTRLRERGDLTDARVRRLRTQRFLPSQERWT